MSSSTQTLADFMGEHNITGRVVYNGTDASGGWEHHEFRFTLEIDGELYLGNARYFAGMGHDPADVSPVDCFGAILSDISSVQGHEDWADWADDLALITDAKSAKKAMQDFAEISARAELLREAIGQDAFSVALEIAQEL